MVSIGNIKRLKQKVFEIPYYFMLKIVCSLFVVLSLNYNNTAACSMAFHPPTNFNPEEYIFIGKIIGYAGPFSSDTLGSGYWAFMVEVTDPVYLPKSSQKYFEIIPMSLGSACDLGPMSRNMVETLYPLRYEIRIVAKETMYFRNNLTPGIVRLDLSPYNNFITSFNFPEIPELHSSSDSKYDYRYTAQDSLKNFLNSLTLIQKEEKDKFGNSFYGLHYFELRKDLYRLEVNNNEKERFEILYRLVRHPHYHEDSIMSVINKYVNDIKSRKELYKLLPPRMKTPAPDTTLHSAIPQSLISKWEQTNGPYGGTISCITPKFVKNNIPFLFAGTVRNGIFRSSDKGKNWIPVNNGLTNRFIYTIAAIGEYIYAGTDSGAFMSEDNGGNWKAINEGFNIKRIFRVNNFVSDEKYIYAGTNGNGIFRSSDNGASWAEAGNGLITKDINSLLVKGNFIFAGTFGGIFRSSDNGYNWQPVNNGLPQNNFKRNLSVTVNSLYFTGDTLLAGTERAGLFLSTDYGDTWVLSKHDLKGADIRTITGSGNNVFLNTNIGIYRSEDYGSSCNMLNTSLPEFSEIKLIIDDSVLFAKTSKGVYISEDNGANWKTTNSGIINTNINHIAADRTGNYALSYETGIFYSSDNGNKWHDISPNEKNGRFKSVVKGSKYLFAATEHSVFRSENNGKTWFNCMTGEYITTLFTEENTVMAGTMKGIFRSDDNGDTWTQYIPGNFIRAVYKCGDILFAVTSQAILKSSDDGITWLDSYPDLKNIDAVSFTTIGDTIYSVINGIKIIKSTDYGATWSSFDYGYTYYGFRNITSYKNYLIAGTQQIGILISLDRGDSWIPFNYGLEDQHISSLTVKENILYAGTISGVWRYKFIGK